MKLSWTIKNVGYRSKYYWKKFINLLGFCPHCWSMVNYDKNCRALCPKCGK